MLARKSRPSYSPLLSCVTSATDDNIRRPVGPTMVQSARSGSSQIAIRRLASRAQKRVATLSGLRGHGTVAVLPRVVAGHWNRPFALNVTFFGHVSVCHIVE